MSLERSQNIRSAPISPSLSEFAVDAVFEGYRAPSNNSFKDQSFERIEPLIVASHRAYFTLYCDRAGLTNAIEIRLRGPRGDGLPFGFRITEIPTSIQISLSRDLLRKVPSYRLAGRICEVIDEHIAADGALTQPTVIPFRERSGIPARLPAPKGILTELTSTPTMSFREWANEGVSSFCHRISRCESGLTLTMEQYITYGDELDLHRRIVVPGNDGVMRVFSETIPDGRPNDRVKLTATSDYVARLFAAFGPAAAHLYLLESLETQIEIMRSQPIQVYTNERKNGQPQTKGAETVKCQNGRAKITLPSPLEKSILENGVVVERHAQRANAIIIRASVAEGAPSVVIGKPVSDWPSLFDKGRAKRSFDLLSSGDPASRVLALSMLEKWNFCAVPQAEGPSTPGLVAAYETSGGQPSLAIPVNKRTQGTLALAHEMLNGREVLQLSNRKVSTPAFSELHIALDKVGDGYLSFASEAAVQLEFLLPKFNEDRDQFKLSQYLRNVVHTFAEQPALAVQGLLRDAQCLHYSYDGVGRNFAEDPFQAHGDFGGLPADARTLTALNALLAVYSSDALARHASITPIRSVLDRLQCQEGDIYLTTLGPCHGIEYELHFGARGLDSVKLFYLSPGFWQHWLSTMPVQLDPGEDPINHALNVVGKLLRTGNDRAIFSSGLPGEEILAQVLRRS